MDLKAVKGNNYLFQSFPKYEVLVAKQLVCLGYMTIPLFVGLIPARGKKQTSNFFVMKYKFISIFFNVLRSLFYLMNKLTEKMYLYICFVWDSNPGQFRELQTKTLAYCQSVKL